MPELLDRLNDDQIREIEEGIAGPVRGRVRELTAPARLRAAEDGGTGNEFTGIGVPWDDTIEIWGIREEFAPGSIETPDDGCMVFWRHYDPIGLVTEHRDVDAGWEVDGRVSDTSIGRDAIVLLADKVVRKLSIRFEPLEWEVVRDDDGDRIRYTRALVREVSLVPIPAYDNATITQVRQRAAHHKENPPMPEDNTRETSEQLTELRGSVDELTRRVELVATGEARDGEANPLHQFRSFGHWVQALARGDEDATRAYEGVVAGDLPLDQDDHTWVGNMLRLIADRTPTVEFFTHTRDLPPTGENVDFGRLETSTLRVEEQVNEGDDLVFGKIGLAGGGSARVRTIGGWTDLSRQSIERRSHNVVDLAFRGFAIAYANALEAIAKAVLTAVYNARVDLATDPDGAGELVAEDASAVIRRPTLADADDVIDLLLDLAERYDNVPYRLDGIYLGRDLFRQVAHISEEKKILSLTANPDKLGTLSLSSVEASLSNIAVKLWTGAPTGSAAMAVDRQAIKVQESPGAPFRLQDENIINLTKQFSVYGYVAAYSEMPEGVVPILVG